VVTAVVPAVPGFAWSTATSPTRVYLRSTTPAARRYPAPVAREQGLADRPRATSATGAGKLPPRQHSTTPPASEPVQPTLHPSAPDAAGEVAEDESVATVGSEAGSFVMPPNEKQACGPLKREAVVSRKLREIFDRCDRDGKGRASRCELICSCQDNPWLAGFFRLPREGPLTSSNGSDRDREITWAEFWDHCARWAPTPAKRGLSPAPESAKCPRAGSQVAFLEDPSSDQALLECYFPAWGEQQATQHRHVRAWLVSRALSGGTAGVVQPAGGVATQGGPAGQLRMLARDIDVQILSAAGASRANPDVHAAVAVPHAFARLELVEPYIDMLQRDALEDLALRAGGDGVLRVRNPGQAEAAMRGWITQLEQAIVARLNDSAEKPRQSSRPVTSSRGGATPPLGGCASTAGKARRVA